MEGWRCDNVSVWMTKWFPWVNIAWSARDKIWRKSFALSCLFGLRHRLGQWAVAAHASRGCRCRSFNRAFVLQTWSGSRKEGHSVTLDQHQPPHLTL